MLQTTAGVVVCASENIHVFLYSFSVCFVAKRYIHTTAKVPERTNRNGPARNTLAQLLAMYTNPESHSTQRYRQTDGRATW